MFGKSFHLFDAFGFPIRIDASWILIALLITWSLASGVFPAMSPGMSPLTYWLMGVCGALGLFTSIVLHELAHAVVARRHGMHIRAITLFIFGGVAELQDEPPRARAEFLVAIAGPIASILIAAGLWGLGLLGGPLIGAPALWAVITYLATINAVLVAFNLIPAFPLDGGRVLRSILWKWKDDLQRATRISSQIGSGFGAALIVVGVFFMITGNFLGGFWWILIGMFLRSAAQMAYRQVIVRRALEGEPVWRFMQREPHTVPPWVTVSDFVEDYVYRHHHKMFPVVSDGRLEGCISTTQLRDLPREDWPMRRVEDVLKPCSPENTISPQEDALTALSRLHRTGQSRLMVVDRGRLVGILTLKDLLRFLSLRVELDPKLEAEMIEPMLAREAVSRV